MLLNLNQPVMNRVLCIHQFALQVSDGHFLLLERGEILLWVRGSDAMVVSTGVVAAQARSSVGQRDVMTVKRQGLPLLKPTLSHHFPTRHFKTHSRKQTQLRHVKSKIAPC